MFICAVAHLEDMQFICIMAAVISIVFTQCYVFYTTQYSSIALLLSKRDNITGFVINWQGQ